MREHEASRTLLKSPPELWEECSDASSLARHLGAFGEIRITRMEPETAVAWEGESATGTVRLEPSGWGTRVILTARSGAAPAAAGPPPPVSEPAPVSQPASMPESLPAPQDPRLTEAPRAEATLAPAEPPAAHPALAATAAQTRRPGLIARLMAWWGLRREPIVLAPPVEEEGPSVDAAAEPVEDGEPVESAEDVEPAVALVEPPGAVGTQDDQPDAAVTILNAALDSLGQAHHRPFSRA